ncbi:type IX secretion system membrane protein PorP/SprF [Salinimicrobium sp. MT39]|uniref:Type IX secretion system membrane protein PorP/SprF n=1 Tax=Salinimicrobium profundisediminis TaxID=2994553 RepID=A0A9X3CX00_9FLAO|nr:type IX secretion system membrane protein PorP/SprF [Salinimicrobium profundisediminis]MCX2838068.1 type IX secretion system membrane protein PorP/SprF [Salinimicrobium profundisediminis]
MVEQKQNNSLLKSHFWILILCTFFNIGESRGQEIIPTYSDYLTDNLFLLHPSLAGAAVNNQLRLTARQQWFDIDDAPGLQTLTINGRLGNKEGIGAILFNDRNGNFSKSGAYGAFAYHLRLPAGDLQLHRLSFGISAGVIQHRLDQSGFTQPDPLLGQEKASVSYANMDVGMSYFNKDLYIHATAKNLLPVTRELFNSHNIATNQRRYFLTAGYIISPAYDWYLEPSAMLQLVEDTSEKLADVNLKAYRNFEFGQIWAGLSYRQGLDKMEGDTENLRYLTPFAGVEYRKFLVGYTFSRQFNEVVLSNSGFHQITLGYNFGAPRTRYHCGCPAIN